MITLGLDIGSSSVKAGVLRNGNVVGHLVHSPFPTSHDGVKVKVQPDHLLNAVASAIQKLGSRAKKVDLIALSVMSPAWVAMDRRGKPLTPIVTHQDRRSVEVAISIEKKIGKARFLKLAGNRPFPGGISVTTWAWYLQNEPQRLKRVALAGHLNTFLHFQFSGARVIDPANASFTGLYLTAEQKGWSRELCEATGVDAGHLPEIREANAIAGSIHAEAARRFGLTHGTPAVVGVVDTSSAMLLIGAKPGQLLNICGSTDVLGLCTDHAYPDEHLLTRALGVGKRWMSVSTLAAAGSSLNWAKDQLFVDLNPGEFWKLVSRLGLSELRKRKNSTTAGPPSKVRFEPYLAGDRMSLQQRQAAFSGLTLGTTREQMLQAIVEALAEASAARIRRFRQRKMRMNHDVVVSGGVRDGLDKLLHRDWPGKWDFRVENEATLRGLSKLEPVA